MLAGDISIKFPSVIVVTIIQYFTLGSKPISRVPPKQLKMKIGSSFGALFFRVSSTRPQSNGQRGVDHVVCHRLRRGLGGRRMIEPHPATDSAREIYVRPVLQLTATELIMAALIESLAKVSASHGPVRLAHQFALCGLEPRRDCSEPCLSACPSSCTPIIKRRPCYA